MKDFRDRATAFHMKVLRAAHVVGGAIVSMTGIVFSGVSIAQGDGTTRVLIGVAISVAGGAVVKAGLTGDSDAIARVRRAKALREARREALEAGRKPPVELSEKESIRRLKQDLERAKGS